MQTFRRDELGLAIVIRSTNQVQREVLNNIPEYVLLEVMGHRIELSIQLLPDENHYPLFSGPLTLAIVKRIRNEPNLDTTLINIPIQVCDQNILTNSSQLALLVESNLYKLLPFNELLRKHTESSMIKLHTPTHTALKHTPLANSYILDIDSSCSVPYFDSLIEPHGQLLESEKLITFLYRTEHTYYCTGGASLANAIAIFSLASNGGKFLVDRTCHQSIHRALKQSSAIIDYIEPRRKVLPELSVLDPEDIRDLIDSKGYNYFIYNACTYEGVVADNSGLVQLCHDNEVIVMADESWLSHGIFSLNCETSLDAAADIVVHSPHKMMGALSQGALLHSNLSGDLAGKLYDAYKTFTTSSPSFPVIASIEYACVYFLLFGEILAEMSRKNIEHLTQLLHTSNYFKVPRDIILGKTINLDPFKLNIYIESSIIRGTVVSKMLFDEFDICVEKASDSYITLIICPHMPRETVECIAHAMLAVDKRLTSNSMRQNGSKLLGKPFNGLVELSSDGIANPFEGADAVSENEVVLYPPGIPVFLAGESVSAEGLDRLYKEVGYPFISAHGLIEFEDAFYLVVREGY